MNPNAMEPQLRADAPFASSDGPGFSRTPPRRSRGTLVFLVLLAALVGIGIWGVTQFLLKPQPLPPIADSATPPSAAPAASSPPSTAPRYPVDTAPAAPLPALNESDSAFVSALGSSALGRWLVPKDLIRHVVITVDNLPRKSMRPQMWPVRPAAGTFIVTDGAIAPTNAERYTPMVRALEAADPEKLVAVYVRWYPLFQEAYREQGYPDGNFNDRLVETLDSLLATPNVSGNVAVTQPKVLWQFADPALEALPVGQKIMLRMGPDNERRVKAKLTVIRALVAREAPH